MTACVRGCMTARTHLADCMDTTACRGCTPRPAEHGVMCTPCHGRLVRSLYTAPDVVQHLLDVGTGSTPAGETITGSRERPTLIPAATETADEIHAALASWVRVVLEEHPDDLTGPSTKGQRVTEHTMRVITSAGWLVGCGDCTGLDSLAGGPRSVTSSRAARVAATTHYDLHPEHVVSFALDADRTWHVCPRPADVAGLAYGADAGPTYAAAAWLRTHLGWIERQEWVGELLEETASRNAQALARWPREERSRRIPGAPCPTCDRLTLIYHPPTVAGADVTVQCEHTECGVILGERDWPEFVQRYDLQEGAA